MKQKLLFFISAMLLFVTFAVAQDRTWEIGTTSASWPIDLAQLAATSDPDPPNTYEIDGLTVFAGSSAFGGMRASSLSSGTFSDAFVPDQEWTSNGSSSGTVALPARRYFKFPVSGPSTIKVWFASNSTSIAAVRSCQIGDGVNSLGTLGSTWRQDPQIITAVYNGGGDGNIYVSSDQSILYYKISVVDGVLGVNDFKSPVTTNLKSYDGRIYISNVTTNTEINIYSITGALVKSFKTNTDTDFGFKTGLWIATAKTEEGQKVVKLVVQ